MQSVPDYLWEKAVVALTETATEFLDQLPSEERKVIEHRLKEASLSTTKTVLGAVADDLRSSAWQEGHKANADATNPYGATQ